MDTVAYILLLGVLIWSPLAFGAVHPPAQAVMSLGVFTASVLLAVRSVSKDWKTGAWQVQLPATSLNLVFLLFLLFLLFQLLPLPEPVLKFLSHESWIISQKGSPASQAIAAQVPPGTWFSISPYAGPVQQSLVLWVTYGLFFFGFRKVLSSKSRIDAAVIAILVMGCFETVYGIGQTFTGSNYIWWFKKQAYLEDVTGTYINRNHFACLMAMVMLLGALYAAALSEKKKSRSAFHRKRHFRARLADWVTGEQRFNKVTFVLFAAAASGIGLIFSASRGGMIAAAGGLLLTAILLMLRQRQRRKGVIVLCLFLIVSLYAMAIGIEYPARRFGSFDVDMTIRSRYAQQALRLFQDYPAVGTGIGLFRYCYPKYQATQDTKIRIDHAHNDWVQFLSEGGVVGLILLLAGVLYYLFHAVRLWKRRHEAIPVCLGIAPFAALAAVGIHSWSDFNLHIPANFLMLSAILAIGDSAVRLPSAHNKTNAPRQHRSVPLKYRGAVLLVLLGVAVVWSGAWSFRRGVGGSFHYASGIADAKTPGTQALPNLEAAAAWDPASSEYLYDLSLALRELRRETPIHPGPDDPDKKTLQQRIIRTLEHAIRLNPLREEAHIRLAWEYINFWSEPDAAEKWMPAADLSMERAAYFAGENNPFLHVWMGDYWTIRSKTVSPTDPRWETMLARARWHFRKNQAIETGDDRKRMREHIQRSVWAQYPDPAFVDRMLEE